MVVTRLMSASAIPTLEGAAGVGKTSIVSVATYELTSGAASHGRSYLALDRPLQLDPTETPSRFTQKAYLAIARTLLTHSTLLTQAGIRRREVTALRQWLQDPSSRQHGMTFTGPFGWGLGVQRGSSQTNSRGFEDEGGGFERVVGDWLERCFGDGQAGGIVCLIDNLEVLRSSNQARQTVEALRDGLFAQRGLRWVMCGTPDVIRGPISPRMEGRLSEPIHVPPIDERLAPDVVMRRIEIFGSPDAYVPVDGRGFERIYSVLNRHLRFSLDSCQRYAMFLSDEGRRPEGGDAKLELLNVWMASRADAYADEARGIPMRSLKLFETLTESGGEATGRDADLFRVRTAEELAAAAEPLEAKGFLTITAAPEGDETFVLQVTSKGWLLRFQQRGYRV
jgi:hypothetical protein